MSVQPWREEVADGLGIRCLFPCSIVDNVFNNNNNNSNSNNNNDDNNDSSSNINVNNCPPSCRAMLEAPTDERANPADGILEDLLLSSIDRNGSENPGNKEDILSKKV